MSPDPLATYTLAEAVEKLIYLVDCNCGQRARIDLRALEKRYGPTYPPRKVKGKLKCSQCQGRKFIITTLWKSATTSIESMRRWPMPGD
jgi:hypothetical protein